MLILYDDPTEDDEAAEAVRIRFAGGISAPHEHVSSEDAAVVAAAEIPAASLFLATVTRTGFVLFFSFIKSAMGEKGDEWLVMDSMVQNDILIFSGVYWR